MKFILFALVVTALVAVVCADQSIEDEVKDIIKNNKIVVFSKSYCPYCKYSIYPHCKNSDLNIFEIQLLFITST